MSAVTPIPEGFRTITPHLTVKDCENTVEFYKNAFGATLHRLSKDSEGRVMHAAIQIGDSMVMLHDEYPEWGALSPAGRGGSSVAINIYTEDAKKFWDRAVAAGAKVRMPLADQFWGDRYGQLEDPSGHVWAVAQRIATPTQEEMAAALQKSFSEGH